jgi:hypothetical protein
MRRGTKPAKPKWSSPPERSCACRPLGALALAFLQVGDALGQP